MIEAFMPALCNHIDADKIFVQPKKLQNPSLQDDEMEKRRNYSTVISALLLS
jgi:hypothetical protein